MKSKNEKNQGKMNTFSFLNNFQKDFVKQTLGKEASKTIKGGLIIEDALN